MIRRLSLLSIDSSQKEYFPAASLAISGFMDGKLNAPIFELQKQYSEILCKSRKLDSIAGRTLEGPHRSDFIVYHSKKGINADRSSTGEQKALLIGIFLAHARLISSITGFAPILLLDEIAAHLDERRRAVLFDIVGDIGGQIFMTGTDKAIFSSLSKSARFIQISKDKMDYV